jgi:hypothetical protein
MEEFIIGNEGEDREKPKVGTVRGLVIGIYDIGWQVGFQGSVVKKILYLWEIDQRLTTGQHKDKRHLVSQSYKQSMHEKSGHSKMLEGMLGKKFTDEERVAHNVMQHLNKPCLLSLVASKDGKYVNVDNVLPMMAGQEPIVRETPSDYTPEWILKKIEEGKSKPVNEQNETAVKTEEPPVTELDKARALAKSALLVCHESHLFDSKIELMKKMLVDNSNNLPTLKFLAEKWRKDFREAEDAEFLKINEMVK